MRYGVHPTKTPARMANLYNLNTYGPARIMGRVASDMLRLGWIQSVYVEGSKKGAHAITDVGRSILGVAA